MADEGDPERGPVSGDEADGVTGSYQGGATAGGQQAGWGWDRLRRSALEWIAGLAAAVRGDRTALGLALAMALLTVVLVARGLTLSESGGLLRLTPYVSLLLAPLLVALCVMRPWEGLIAWVIVMPVLNIARVAVDIGPLQVILPTVIILAIALGLALASRRNAAAERTQASITERAAYLGVAAVIALTIASLVLGSAPLARSVPIALHGMIEPALLFGLVVALRASRRQATALALALGASVALASAFNLVRIVVVAHLLPNADEMRIQLARLTYYNVGIFGDMLAMALPLLVAAFLLWRALRGPRPAGVLIALGILVSLVGLYLTLSKSAWLGALVSIAVLLMLLATSWRRRLVVAVACLVLFTAVVPYPAYVLRAMSPDLAARYEQVTSIVNSRSSTIDPGTPEGEVSVTERLLATSAAIRMAIDHPLLGVGPGAFAGQYQSRYRQATATRQLDSAHDLLPYVAAEFGLAVALLIGLGLLGGIVRATTTAVRSRHGDRVSAILAPAIVAALVGFVVVSATFGVDLYRDYRLVNSDVLFAAILTALAVAMPDLAWSRRTQPEVGPA